MALFSSIYNKLYFVYKFLSFDIYIYGCESNSTINTVNICIASVFLHLCTATLLTYALHLTQPFILSFFSFTTNNFAFSQTLYISTHIWSNTVCTSSFLPSLFHSASLFSDLTMFLGASTFPSSFVCILLSSFLS